MPPKKSKLKKDKVENNETDILKEGVSNVEIKLFEGKFKAIEKIITRLKADNIIRKNNIDKYNRKSENVDNKLKNEYENAKAMLEEKFTLKKKLNAEVDDLQKELISMDELMKEELKLMDDEFLREVRKIKSITAVHVGRNNKLEEFTKQEKMLEQKYTNMVEQIGIMVDNYEIEVKKYKEKEDSNRQFIQGKMLNRSENFAVDIKKQSLIDNDLLFNMEINKLYDINDKLKLSEEMKIKFKQRLTLEKEEYENVLNLNSSIQENNNVILNDLLLKKKNAKNLETELNNVVVDIHEMQQNLNVDKHYADQLEISREATTDELSMLEKLNQTHELEVQVARVQLNEIRNCIVSLDDKIIKIEDGLFGIYKESTECIEKMKLNTNYCSVEEILDFIGILSNKLNEVIFYPG